MTDIKLNYQMENLENLQAQAGLSETGAQKERNWDKLKEDLGWEPLLETMVQAADSFLQNHGQTNIPTLI